MITFQTVALLTSLSTFTLGFFSVWSSTFRRPAASTTPPELHGWQPLIETRLVQGLLFIAAVPFVGNVGWFIDIVAYGELGQTPPASIGTIDVSSGLERVAAQVAGLAGLFVLTRCLLAVLHRITLGKNDVYFAISLFAAITTFIIGHYWT